MKANFFVVAALLMCCAVSNMHCRFINELVPSSETYSDIMEFQDFLIEDFQRISSGLPLEPAEKFSLAYDLRETEEYENLVSTFKALSQESQQEVINYMSQNRIVTGDSKALHDKLNEY